MSEEDKTVRETLNLDRTTRSTQVRDTQVRASVKKTRRSKLDQVDEFYVPPDEIPDGFSVEWKRYHIYGKEDTPHMNNLYRDGWEPAQPKDFPSLVGKLHKGPYILSGNQQDLILMIRPKELTQEAIHEDKANAVGQVRTKMQELGMAKAGEAPRVDSTGKSLVRVKTSYESIPVSD